MFCVVSIRWKWVLNLGWVYEFSSCLRCWQSFVCPSFFLFCELGGFFSDQLVRMLLFIIVIQMIVSPIGIFKYEKRAWLRRIVEDKNGLCRDRTIGAAANRLGIEMAWYSSFCKKKVVFYKIKHYICEESFVLTNPINKYTYEILETY